MPAVVQCYENNTLNHSEVCRTLSGNHDDRVTDTGTTVVSTNSNGGDVAATVNANMSKLGGDNQTTFGGGYVVSRRGDRA